MQETCEMQYHENDEPNCGWWKWQDYIDLKLICEFQLYLIFDYLHDVLTHRSM